MQTYLTGKKEYRYNIISTDNPLVITLPKDQDGVPFGTRNKKTFEIESFHWQGSFSKVAQGKGDATDIQNVPPLFFQIQLTDNTLNVSGVTDEDNLTQRVLEFAKPKIQFDSVPTITPMIQRVGGNTVEDYGGLSYDYVKVVYGIDENLREQLDISNLPVTTTSISLKINTVYSYIDADKATKYNNGPFVFENRAIQGLNSVSEPYVMRVLIVDE